MRSSLALWIVLALAGCRVSPAMGAAAATPKVTVRLEPAEVYLGSPARLEVTLSGPAGFQPDLAGLTRAIAGLDGVHPEAVRNPEPGTVVLSATLTPFQDPQGPPEVVQVPWRDGDQEGSLSVWVPAPRLLGLPGEDGDEEGVLREAKGVVEPRPASRLPWLLGLVALAALWAGVRALRRPRPPPPPPPPEPPLDRALRLLADLEEAGPEGDPRAFHYRLSEVTRDFLSRRFMLSGLSETSDELVDELEKVEVPGQGVARVRTLLGVLDRVKFGPDETPVEACDPRLVEARKLVQDLARPADEVEAPPEEGDA